MAKRDRLKYVDVLTLPTRLPIHIGCIGTMMMMMMIMDAGNGDDDDDGDDHDDDE